jgi:hypothetical protein
MNSYRVVVFSLSNPLSSRFHFSSPFVQSGYLHYRPPMKHAAVLSMALLILGAATIQAQPPSPPVMGGGGITVSGQSTSTSCTLSDGTTCARDGSSNQVGRSLTYDSTTGKFSGTMIMNQCSNNLWGRDTDGSLFTQGAGHTVSCKQQTFPAPDYSSIPTGGKAAPTRSPVGFSLYGVNMYGPFEAGFSAGQACDNNVGTCDAGLDLGACEAKLTYECGSSHVIKGMLMDSCGGHASPYHYHTRMNCDESNNNGKSTWSSKVNAGHSPLVGIALDGRGIYGQLEATGTAPSDLDACGGHVGTVPVITADGITGHSDTAVYHYHTQAKTPYILGCFGPATYSQCVTAYSSTCNTGYSTYNLSTGQVQYDTDCPCVQSTATTTTAAPTTTTTTAAPGSQPSTSIPQQTQLTYVPMATYSPTSGAATWSVTLLALLMVAAMLL